jgi:hypothetical protein
MHDDDLPTDPREKLARARELHAAGDLPGAFDCLLGAVEEFLAAAEPIHGQVHQLWRERGSEPPAGL